MSLLLLLGGAEGAEAPAPPARIAIRREFLPDDLYWYVEPPQGRPSRWAADEALVENLITDMRLVDEMPGGDKEGSGVLARDPRTSWSDLVPFSDITVRGPGGEEVAHYRLDKTPESDGEHMAITTEAVGWSKALEDDNALIGPGFIDSDLTKWGEPSTARRIALLANNELLSETESSTTFLAGAAVTALLIQILGKVEGKVSEGEFWYRGGGPNIARALFDFLVPKAGGDPTNQTNRVGLCNDDLTSGAALSADFHATAANQQEVATGEAGKKFAYFQSSYGGAATGTFGGDTYGLSNVKVIGDHGLALQGTWPDVGFTVSQMLGWAIPRFTVLEARPEDLEDLGYIIGQAWFSDPGPISQVVQELSKYELLDWFVFGGKRFQLKQPGTYGRRWQAYVGPSSLQEQGFDASRSWKEILVSYQDVDGTTRTVGPPGSGADVESASLEMTDPDHPAVRAAEAYGPNFIRRDRLDLKGISTPSRAIEVGEIWLREANRLNRSGSAVFADYLMDDCGVMRPVSHLRAGDRVRFPDAADTSYRSVVRRTYEHATRTCTVDLDAPPEGLQALLERLQADIQSLSFS